MPIEYKDQTFNQWIAMWHDLNVALFGEAEAKEMAKDDAARNNALRKLWKVKGFKTLGEFEEWEKTHMEEKNAFLSKELNAQNK